MDVCGPISMKKRGRLTVVLFLISIGWLVGANTGMFGDTSKTKYDISDPRHPDCPCHKHQKKAEKEYRKWLEAKKKGKTEVNLSVTKVISPEQTEEKTAKTLTRKPKQILWFKTVSPKYSAGVKRKRSKKKWYWPFGKQVDACYK